MFGNSNIDDYKFGSYQIDKIMCGVNMIWQKNSPQPNLRFKATATSDVEPTATWIQGGGTLIYTDNQDGTWNIESDDIISEVSWQGNTDITTFEVVRAPDLWRIGAGALVSSSWQSCTNLVSFDGSGLTEVTDTKYTWKGCTSLKYLDISALSKVTSLQGFVQDCTSLECINSMIAPNVTGMGFAFDNTPALVHPNAVEQAQYFTTTGVNWINPEDCPLGARFKATATSDVEPTAADVTGGTLTYTDLGGTPKRWSIESNDPITKVSWMSNTDITTFEVQSAKDLTELGDGTSYATWAGCANLTSFDTSGLTNVTNASGAWSSCSGLTSFDTSPLTNVTDASHAWASCSGLTSFDTSGLTSVTSCLWTWNGCSGLVSFDASGLGSVADLKESWHDCTSLQCISSFTAPNVFQIYNAFKNTPALVHPNAAEQAQYFTDTGVNWINPEACPLV